MESTPISSDARDPGRFGRTLARAIGDEPLIPLAAGSPDRSPYDLLSQLAQDWREELSKESGVGDQACFDCCVAAVWLLHGFLDEAHALVQEHETAEASYWHGMVHRLEGDYGNAKYWFRRAGELPTGAAIASEASAHPETVECVLGGEWDPLRFVDAVQSAVQRKGPAATACLDVQRAEWWALMDWCWRKALGR